jgi:hypothetical protein
MLNQGPSNGRSPFPLCFRPASAFIPNLQHYHHILDAHHIWTRPCAPLLRVPNLPPSYTSRYRFVAFALAIHLHNSVRGVCHLHLPPIWEFVERDLGTRIL